MLDIWGTHKERRRERAVGNMGHKSVTSLSMWNVSIDEKIFLSLLNYPLHRLALIPLGIIDLEGERERSRWKRSRAWPGFAVQLVERGKIGKRKFPSVPVLFPSLSWTSPKAGDRSLRNSRRFHKFLPFTSSLSSPVRRNSSSEYLFTLMISFLFILALLLWFIQERNTLEQMETSFKKRNKRLPIQCYLGDLASSVKIEVFPPSPRLL